MNRRSPTSRDAPTGHKLFKFISFSFQSRRWAHIKRWAENMKTTTQVATVLLLLVITGWHLWCSLFAVYIALLGKQPWMLGILVVILFPPIVLIRWAVRGRLMTADLFLVILAVLPGLILGFQEIMKPRSPNIPWLAPLLVVYLLAPILVARLRVSNGNPRHESAR